MGVGVEGSTPKFVRTRFCGGGLWFIYFRLPRDEIFLNKLGCQELGCELIDVLLIHNLYNFYVMFIVTTITC